jgi:hypothetical protein
MGSTSQSPINSYYLLRRYLGLLDPELLVYECYWRVFEGDGLESYLDLVENVDLDSELLRMTFATRNFRSVNALLVRLFEISSSCGPDGSTPGIHRDRYVTGGYVERVLFDTAPGEQESDPIQVNPRQLEYVRRIIRMVESRGIRMALVVQPVPRRMAESAVNLDEYRQVMEAVSYEFDVPFIDFTSNLELDDGEFYDDHHLKQAGVNLFNTTLLEELRTRGLLDRTRGVESG